MADNLLTDEDVFGGDAELLSDEDVFGKQVRQGGTRPEVKPFVALTPDENARRQFAQTDPRRVDIAKTPGQMLEQPNAMDISGRLQAEREQLSQSPALQESNRQQMLQDARSNRAPQEAKPLEITNRLTTDLRESTTNPALRGAVAGAAGLGKVGTGAVRLAADLVGAEDVAKFAAGAEGKAKGVEQGATQDLKGNDKLVADVFASVVNSTPSMALGMFGGPALKTLFAQSALAEYGSGRDAGFSIEESATRAGIMGAAEAIGERLGFPEQMALFKSMAKNLPTGELAKTFGSMLTKEIPGEQLTTAIQFLADKMGPAALNPNATLDQYLEAAGETLKVTIGQSLLMGGGPAAVGAVRNEYARTDAMRADPVASFLTPKPAPDKPVLKPSEARAASIDRFGELAAGFGLPEKALAKAREAAANMPAGDVPGFLSKLADAYNKRGMFAKPLDPAAVQELQAAIDGPTEEAPKPKAAVPDQALNVTGLAEDDAVDTSPESVQVEPAQVESDSTAPVEGEKTDPGLSGWYALSDAISADGPTAESVRVIVRPDGAAAIQRDNGDVIDITNMIRAGFTPERAIAQSLGDDTSGANVKREQAPVASEKINRNWSAFAPETGTLNIPRAQMPQIAAEHRGALVNFLNARGVDHEMDTVDPATLKPTQAEFEPKKVAAIAENPSTRSILVSADGHIIDGHHQWLAARERGDTVRVVRLNAPAQDLLRLAHQFPSSTVAKGPTRKAANDQPVVPDPAVGVPGAGAAGADPAGAGAVTVRPVAADADRGATVDPGAPAAGGGSGVPAGRDGAPDAALSREPSKIRRGQIGDKMTPGEVVLTASGRQTTPFPRFSLNSNRGAQAGVRAVDRWLLENATAEARARGDEFNAKPFEADAELKSIPQASKDAAEEYLFGEQPQIAPSILKPLVPQKAAARVIGSYGKTPNAATEVELRPNADGTLTPHADGYAMVDFETGDPIKLPADVTDSGAAKAIRESGAVSSKTKFFNVKPDAEEAQAEAKAQAKQAQRMTARERIDGLKKLLACLQS